MLGFILACPGCQKPQQKPVWEDIKFRELAAPRHTPSAQNRLEPPFQFDVYIFNVPLESFSELKTAWQALETEKITFKSRQFFNQNGFAAGLGQRETWPGIAEVLRGIESENSRTVDLIMADNSTERVFVKQLDSEKNIFYKTQTGQLSGSTVGPGKALIRLTASTIPDRRGVCRLTVEPAFTGTERSALAAAPEEITFDSMPFTATMSQGDFVLLGPRETKQEMALGSIFFSLPDKPEVQLYLIFCMRVNN